MLPLILSFLCGDLFLQTFSSLPSRQLLMVCLPLVILSSYCLRSIISLPLMIAFLAGFFWTTEYARDNLSRILPKELEKQPLCIRGYVATIPMINQNQTAFHFSTDEHNTYRLIWRHPVKTLRVGDKWELWVSLKRIHSTQNYNTFDYERWALLNGLHATGQVLDKAQNKFLYHDVYSHWLNQLRAELKQKMILQLPKSATAHWLMALLIGEREGIAQEEWEILRKTGTNHLMAIAGLHIGIISGLVYFLFFYLWRYIPTVTLYIPAPHAAAAMSLLAALFYSTCAGFSLPTQRACLMLVFHVLTFLCKRQAHAWESWCLALGVVLLINPLNVLSESFWLSFVTIALIIFGMSGRLKANNWWWKWGRVQWVISIGLIPLSLLFFNECSLISTFANTIAIPMLSFLILPFCFLSMLCLIFSSSLTHVLLIIADTNLHLMWMFLTWCAKLPFATWIQTIPSTMIGVGATIGIICLLMPIGLPGRWLGLGWLLPLIFFRTEHPANKEMWLTLLDVGQGLSVIVQTQTHLLVYDTGNRFQNFDAGKNIILPYLATIRAHTIDMLVISHGDNDHSGGAKALITHTPIKNILTSVPEKFPSATFCRAGLNWNWDGINFRFLSPMGKDKLSNNNASCVLQIDNGTHQILLPGDIEKKTEDLLTMTYYHALRATILVAPHHGSHTSSTLSFLNFVHPRFVLYATGYANRYHFPHPNIFTRYQRLGVRQYDTKETGLMQFKINTDSSITSLFYREKFMKYWMT